jgi:hypothetical protein
MFDIPDVSQRRYVAPSRGKISSTLKMVSTNEKVRALLAAQEQRIPGSRARATRLATYAVAIGDHLGLDQDTLLRLRLSAELNGIEILEESLKIQTATDDYSKEIIDLCEEFDAQSSTEFLSKYNPDLLAALRAIEPIIQPLGST